MKCNLRFEHQKIIFLALVHNKEYKNIASLSLRFNNLVSIGKEKKKNNKAGRKSAFDVVDNWAKREMKSKAKKRKKKKRKGRLIYAPRACR